MLRQQERIAVLKSPFGEDVLSIVSIDSEEALSEGFETRIEALSERDDLDFDKALARHMTVTVTTNNRDRRHFDGLLTNAQWIGIRDAYYVYRLTLRPWSWLLTKATNSRIFERDMTAPEIIKQVFSRYDFCDYDDRLTETYDPIHYCVQYRESDFAFVSRLMEEFGISYFFEFGDQKHTMVLADGKSSFSPVKGNPSIPFIAIGGDSQRDEEHIYTWMPGRMFRTGKMTVNDFDFKKPSASLIADREAGSRYRAGSLERYDYPGRYTEKDKGRNFARLRLEAEQAADRRVQSAGEVPRLHPGALFSLNDHPHQPQNKEYLVVRASHSLITELYRTGGAGGGQGEAYTGQYDVLSSDIPFRTPMRTAKPRIAGPQTAKVVGDGEIDVDEYGQILVEFHWDRDKTASRRVRVAQIWSGKNWGGIVIPRVGQEVIVQFLEGDPDQPIIIGTVYNAEYMPPYPLPSDKNIAGVKSNSTTGGGGYNEFVFDDTKGSEVIGLHAQKDHNLVIDNNETRHVKNCVDNTIDVNRTEFIGDTWTVEAGKKIEFIVGSSKIVMDPTSIKIESVKIDGKASATLSAKSPMTTVKGDAKLVLKGGLVTIN